MTTDVRGFGSGSAPPAASALNQLPKGQVTEVASTQVINNGAYNAFPWVARNTAGTLFCTYRAGTTHLSPGGTVQLQTSSDGGATWSAATSIATPNGVTTLDFRDPSIVVTSTQRLVVNFYDYNNTLVTYPGIYTMHSDDNGVTWSTPVKITPFTSVNVTDAAILAYSDNKTLLMPVYGENTGDTNYRNAVMTSVDNGVTWTGPTYINAANTGLEETTLIELANGVIMAFTRDDVTAQVAVNTSSDIGATWTAPVHLGFAVTPGRPCAGIFPNGQIILYYRAPSTEYVTWRSSFDYGNTWSAATTNPNRVYVYAGVCLIPGTNPLLGFVEASEISSTQAEISFTTYEKL